MRLFLSRQTLVTLSAGDHQFGTRHNWPVGPGRKPTSKTASKKVAVCRPFVICRDQPRGKRWMAYLRASWTRGFLPLQTFRGRSDRAFRSLDRLVSFLQESSGTRAKSPSSCPVILGLSGFGFFCRRIVRHWMVPEGDRQLRGSLRGSPVQGNSWRCGGALSGTTDRCTLLTYSRDPGQPRRRRCP